MKLVHRGVSRRFTSVEFAIEKVRSGAIGGEPILMQKKIVHFVGEDELFDFDVFGAEAGDEINGLGEVDVSVVVAVNEQNGRFPGVRRR